jgi:thiol-disulfide isomerase/thioredoxin
MRFPSFRQQMFSILQAAAMATAFFIGLPGRPAPAESLTVGSPAPALDIEHWFHDHQPVTAFEAGKVYVVEFWATWCGPCIASMPTLAEIQKKYPDDLVVISVSKEEPATIEEFLDRERGGTTHRELTAAYRLATDPDGSASEDYMRAAGQSGIPCAFLVGKTGEIEWIGHPMRMHEPAAQVIADEWDREAFAAEREEEKMVRARMQPVSVFARQNKFPEALAGLDAILAEVKSERIRQGLAQSRLRLKTQADAYAVQKRRAAEEGEIAKHVVATRTAAPTDGGTSDHVEPECRLDGKGYEVFLVWKGSRRHGSPYAWLTKQDIEECRESFPSLRDHEIIETSRKHGFLRLFIGSATKKTEIEKRAVESNRWRFRSTSELTTRQTVETNARDHAQMIY